ncbi:MAG: DUF3990 domain-containing protein [Oscillospiraceae bacterium]|nr:DUF3990 domain-containing protein [Oscillospiraceae bacterium]
MILYHGSYLAVEKPDLSFSRERTDFGKGFYLTPLKDQAIGWANRFKDEHGASVISSYTFLSKAGEKLPEDIRILEFDTHNLEWLEFITSCRLGLSDDIQWDIIIGGVANDKVFDTVQLYFDNLLNANEAIGRLRYNKPNFQYCFKTQDLIDNYLEFSGSEVLQ